MIPILKLQMSHPSRRTPEAMLVHMLYVQLQPFIYFMLYLASKPITRVQKKDCQEHSLIATSGLSIEATQFPQLFTSITRQLFFYEIRQWIF